MVRHHGLNDPGIQLAVLVDRDIPEGRHPAKPRCEIPIEERMFRKEVEGFTGCRRDAPSLRRDDVRREIDSGLDRSLQVERGDVVDVDRIKAS
ncbi:MAG TPA: hypothetical protein VN783_06020 [Thermoanaerobaculia bacterium]|nr:hypothetical protein [Thermoanaerobaculia bacterium]